MDKSHIGPIHILRYRFIGNFVFCTHLLVLQCNACTSDNFYEYVPCSKCVRFSYNPLHSAVAEGGGGNSGLRSSSTCEEKEVSLASFCVRICMPMLIPWNGVELVILLIIIS